MSLVFIVADSVRHDILGCYGGMARTPTIDRLAGEGNLFERVVSAAPWTVPSVASMLTGVYAHRLGLAKWEQPWPSEHPTLFELAASAGYKVASFVFDPSHLFRRVPSAGVAGSSQNTSSILSWLRNHRDDRFLLFIHYWWTHVPYVAKPMTTSAWLQVTNRVLATMRSGQKAKEGVKKLYRLAVEKFSEEWLPLVLAEIDMDTTWLLLTADHGESWGERAQTTKLKDVFDLHGNTLYDEVIRVPLIVHPPGGAKPRRISGMTRTVDLLPTLTELMSLSQVSGGLDGISLADCIRTGSPPPIETAISVANRDFVDLPDLPEKPADLWSSFALTTGRHKQIWEPSTNRRVTFDLENDPNETIDVSADYAELLELGWRKLEEELTRARVGNVLTEDTRRIRERLRRLGYID
ncbi:MAG: sulfatase [Deltaproteobacteria bacterium]|nr:sulfatase [Deltaproteobacteria bacterium]